MNVQQKVAINYGAWEQKFGDAWKRQIAALKEKFASAIEEVWLPESHNTDIPVIFVAQSKFVQVMEYVRDADGFEYDFLTDYTASDEMPESPRFHIIVQLFSTTHFWRLRFKVKLSEGKSLPTLIPVWPGADWAEREIWDMFGIKFDGHPDLRRILMDLRWEGHPLRKDYPIRGYQLFPTPEPIDTKLLEGE